MSEPRTDYRPVGAAYAPPHDISPTWARISYLAAKLTPAAWLRDLALFTAAACVVIGQAVHWLLIGLAAIAPDRIPQ